jgi:3-oxoadipate enol-lactonase
MKAACPLPDGGRISYRVIGDVAAGTPILLLRPFAGSMVLWGAFQGRLARERPVVAFDPRGVGDSSPCPLGITTRSMAADARSLLDHLGIPRAHVFGLSLGGMAASWLAIDHPDRIDHLVLASTLPRWGTISWHGARTALSLLACFRHPGHALESCMIGKILSSGFRLAHPDRVARIERGIRAHPARKVDMALLFLAAARHGVAPGEFPKHVPTLLLVGEHDPIVGAGSQKELLLDVPNARLEIVPDSGHDLTLEQPIVTAELVLEFVRGRDGISPWGMPAGRR